MNTTEPIPVNSVWDQHTTILTTQCDCGDIFDWTQFTLGPIDARPIVEHADIRCPSCQSTCTLTFDITSFFNKPHRDWELAWPPSNVKPYPIAMLSRRKSDVDAPIEFLVAGRYHIVGERAGSMARAILCADTQNPEARFVVCKSIALKPDQTDLEALEREITIYTRLTEHPNVVSLLDIIPARGAMPTLVLEAVLPGPSGCTTIEDWLREEPHRIQREAARITGDIIHGLRHCQACIPGFVHGDIAANNVFIDTGWLAKLADFGTSTLPDRPPSNVQGTPLYRAPERWHGVSASVESDVYSIAMLFVNLALGKHPFGQRALYELKRLHQNAGASIPALGSLEHQDLLKRALAPDPNARPSIDELAQKFPPSTLSIRYANNIVDFPFLQHNRALSQGKAGDWAGAIIELARLAQDFPTVPQARISHALALSRLGRRAEAKLQFQVALQLAPDMSDLHATLAAHFARDMTPRSQDLAIIAANRAIELDPSSITARVTKSAALNNFSMPQEALETLMEAKRIDPGHPDVLYQLVYTYVRLSRKSKARRTLEDFRRTHGESEHTLRLNTLIATMTHRQSD